MYNKKRIKEELYRKQKGLCVWCKNPLGDNITIEHLECQCRGGGSSIRNLALAHKGCNNRRGDISLLDILMAMPPVSFRKNSINI